MGDGTAVDGNLDKVLLGSLDALGNSCLDFVGLAETPSYDAVLVADNDDCCESEGATALGHFGDTVDGDEALLELKVAGRLNLIILQCHNSLEFKATVAGGVSQ